MSDETVTIGELARRMDRLEDSLSSGFDRLADKLGRDYVQAAVYAAAREADHQRLAFLEAEAATSRQRSWQVRLAVTVSLLSVPAGIATAWLVATIVR